MRPETNETAFDWIRNGRVEKRSGDTACKPVYVSNLVPPLFETYVRVLHRIDGCYDDIDNPLSTSENAILKITSCEPLRSFVRRRRTESLGERIRWRELAELLGVPFTAEICAEWFRKKLADPWCWSRFLRNAADGKKEERAALVATLMQVTDGRECFFRFSDIPFYAKTFENDPRLLTGGLNEVCAFLQRRDRLDFEYWWPLDRSWCVCSDYDLSVTIVAGDQRLTSDLLANGVLECIQVTSQTRVDPFVPMP